MATLHKVESVDDQAAEHHHHQQEACSDSADAANNDIDNDNDNDDDNNTSLNKAARLPRWTRQEILVLIQGKKVAENRVRRGRTASTSSLEPKWASVSSYCKSHGVLRGAVQCRKRWSNLAGDFKKIKDWESRLQDESDSFWLMRNDLRRLRKLPGFFDREVFDILDNKKDVPDSPCLLFDSGRTTPADDPLFSDLEASASRAQHLPIPIPAPIPISAKHYQPFTPDTTPTGFNDEKQAASNPEIGSTSHGDRKRKRLLMEDETAEGASLLQVMEKNGRILSAQLEAHNINLKMDREDRKEHAHSLVAVLNKLADALVRIADKL